MAPSGTWTSIAWTQLPATADFGANVATAPWDPTVGYPETTFQVFGWSHGFVGFTIIRPVGTGKLDSYGNEIYTDPTVSSSYSADGVHWHAGQKLPITHSNSGWLEVIRDVIEGPAGLLAVGWTGGCASEYLQSLWTSTDGKTWQPVDTNSSRALTDSYAVTRVSGGAAGYVGRGLHEAESGFPRTAAPGRLFRSTETFANSLSMTARPLTTASSWPAPPEPETAQ